MHAARRSRSARRKTFDVVALLAGPLVALLILVYEVAVPTREHVSLAPGATAVLSLEVPMDRPGRLKHFATGARFPVRCTIVPDGPAHAVHIEVLETSHTVRKLRARLKVKVMSYARAGRRTFDARFTIAGEGDWPRVRVLVDVDPPRERDTRRAAVNDSPPAR